MSDEELLDLYKKEKLARGSQNQIAQTQKPPDVSQSIFNQQSRGIDSPIAQALMMIAGKENRTDDISKLYTQEAIKSQFKDPLQQEDLRSKIEARKAGLEMDETGNVIGRKADTARDEREDRLASFESRRQAGQLRGELNQNQYIKRFREMNSAATGIDSILRDTISRPDLKSKNVGDQALITLYNKILDPLSVVRESEYARTPEGQALMNRIQGFVEKVQSGGSGLTDQDRIEISRAAKVLINNGGQLYNDQLNQYRDLVSSYGIENPEMVLGGFQDFTPYNIDEQILGIQNVGKTQVGHQSALSDDEAYQEYLRAIGQA